VHLSLHLVANCALKKAWTYLEARTNNGDDQADDSAALGASSGGAVGVPVISAQSLTFGERVKISEHSFIEPESLIGPTLGAGIGQWRDTLRNWDRERKFTETALHPDLGVA
jgi:hypothetical protein